MSYSKYYTPYTLHCIKHLALYYDVKELFGRRSQDPYALVYLLAGDGSTYFQDGNEKTVTFDKTLDPPFKTKFEFKVR